MFDQKSSNSDNNNKVNVYKLKTRILLEEKKQKLQSKIIYLSLLLSIGIVGYFLV